MKNSGNLTVTTPSDREIAMARVFDAPRHLVFDAYTRPELVRCFDVFGGWTFALCEIDLTVGGTYRYLWNGPEGAILGIRGTFMEIERNARIVCTERFDPPFDHGEAIDTVTFTVGVSRRIVPPAPRDAVRDPKGQRLGQLRWMKRHKQNQTAQTVQAFVTTGRCAPR
jgi:uncharacterized protein YndB with AHSA1/START domain